MLMVKMYNDEKQQSQLKSPSKLSVENVLNFSKNLIKTSLIENEVIYSN